MNDLSAYRFAGFISYSQKDKRWARRIHRALESYRLPVGIASGSGSTRKLGRFFRDDDELAGAPSLGAALTGALDDSRTLIVVCSPHSARSRWVDAEIAHFKSRGPDARILAVIVDGQPDSDDPEVMCFAPSLLRKVGADGELTDEPDEPLAPDVGKESFDRIVARLVAGIVGVEFDALWQRERRRRLRRRLAGAAATLVLIAAVLGGYAVYLEEERNRLAQESINIAAESRAAADDGRMDEALTLALSALPASLAAPERPVTGAADAALRRVMAGNLAEGVLTRFAQGVDDLRLLGNGQLAIRLADGSVVVVSTDSGAILRSFDAEERLTWLGDGALAYTSQSDETVAPDGQPAIEHRLIVRDLESGETTRALRYSDAHWWLGPTPAVADDGGLVLVHPALSAPASAADDLAVWSVPEAGGDGVPQVVAQVDVPFVDRNALVQGAFVADDAVVVLWGESRKGAALWNFSTGEVRILARGDDPLACRGRLDADPKRRDIQRLSPDRTRLTHARPIAGGGWCVNLWRAATGAVLQPIEVDMERIGGVDALDDDTLVVAPSWRAFLPEGGLWRRDAEELAVLPCAKRAPRVAGVTINDAQWLIRPARSLVACAADQAINLRLGQDHGVHVNLAGHSRQVQALAFDAGSDRLYSGADDGEVRVWDIERAPRPVALTGRALRLAAFEGRVAVLTRLDDGAAAVGLFEADGSPIGEELPFDVAGVSAQPPVRGRLGLVAIPVAHDSVLQVETWECGMLGCPPQTPRRATLKDVVTGASRVVIENLGYGAFLANVPAAIAWNPARTRIAAVTRDGQATLIDVATGRLERLAMPHGVSARRIALVDGVVWVLATDGADEPADRHVMLYRADSGAPLVEQSRDRAQGAQLRVAASGRRAILATEPVPGADRRPGYRLISSDAVGALFTMPHASTQGESLSAVRFFEDDQAVALLFSDNAVPPQRVVLPESAVTPLAQEAIAPLAATLPANMLDPWRIDDPLARAVFSVDDDRLFMLPLVGAGVCAAQAGAPADAAAFSPDGSLLAVSDSNSETTRIHRAADCELVRLDAFGVRNNAARLVFGDDEHLWSLSDDGAPRVVRVERRLAAVFERAVRLRAALGD